MISPERIAELRALCEAATQGPWWTLPHTVMGTHNNARVGLDSPPVVGGASNSDAAFIAASRVAIPELLDEVERLRSMLAGAAMSADARHGAEVMETAYAARRDERERIATWCDKQREQLLVVARAETYRQRAKAYEELAEDIRSGKASEGK